jgi:heme/copper-type cytochrome/quinol oxidase subunit 2
VEARIKVAFLGIVLLVSLLAGISSQNSPSTIIYDEQIQIRVTQFHFIFEFEDGSIESSVSINLISDRKYLFNVTSVSMPHSIEIEGIYFEPAVGEYQMKILTFKEAGEYNLKCTKNCGLEQSSMNAKIIVLPNQNANIYTHTVTEITTTGAVVTRTVSTDATLTYTNSYFVTESVLNSNSVLIIFTIFLFVLVIKFKQQNLV